MQHKMGQKKIFRYTPLPILWVVIISILSNNYIYYYYLIIYTIY